MTLAERAERVSDEVIRILGATPDADTGQAVRAAVEQAIIDAVLMEQERCARVATKCCAEDKDLAHKLSDEIHQTREALIANLSAMR